jgi:hypothetical protein
VQESVSSLKLPQWTLLTVSLLFEPTTSAMLNLDNFSYSK